MIDEAMPMNTAKAIFDSLREEACESAWHEFELALDYLASLEMWLSVSRENQNKTVSTLIATVYATTQHSRAFGVRTLEGNLAYLERHIAIKSRMAGNLDSIKLRGLRNDEAAYLRDCPARQLVVKREEVRNKAWSKPVLVVAGSSGLVFLDEDCFPASLRVTRTAIEIPNSFMDERIASNEGIYQIALDIPYMANEPPGRARYFSAMSLKAINSQILLAQLGGTAT